MTPAKSRDQRPSISIALALCICAGSAFAQEADTPIEETALTAIVEPAPEQEAEAAPQEEATLSEDALADQLNSQQQLQQTYTLKRTINGKIVESEKRTVTLDRNAPYRPTEAGESDLEKLKAAFDSEVLTRVEAFEEAKLDFTIADIDRNNAISIEEFTALIESWRESNTRQAEAPTEELARQREIDAFLEEINPDGAKEHLNSYAREKFTFLSGASDFVTREDYIREYLLDFDSMDVDKDTMLKGVELKRFRALIRGESFEM